ncbi:helix-turn-helix domain-containing protein [Winogradskyella sp. Asnod2-B02-A]|uniref:helix-turn-helix domain-containing protein n=1 Tax=Winogradskyella sp. Asnod2-B02-A TaxID=3160583 RepID=UPI00386ED1C7
MQFGEYLKSLREERQLLQREIASILQMDMALLSKIERGTRKARREQVIAFAEAYNIDPKELDKRWLVDQVMEILKDEEDPKGILKVAEEEIKYIKNSNANS